MLMMHFEAQENWDPMVWQLLYDQQLLLCKLSVATRSSQGHHITVGLLDSCLPPAVIKNQG